MTLRMTDERSSRKTVHSNILKTVKDCEDKDNKRSEGQ